jgi:hypothetical protein
MSKRLSYVHGIFGRTRSGKTYYVIHELIPALRKLHPKKRIIIVNNNPHPTYLEAGITAFPVEKIPWWNPTSPDKMVRQVLIKGDAKSIAEGFRLLFKYFYNGIVFMEDAKKYIQQQPSKQVISFIGDASNHNTEVFLMYWHPSDIPPSFVQWLQTITLFRLGGHISNAKDKLDSAYFDLLPAYDRVMAQYMKAKSLNVDHTDPRMHPYETVNIQ